MDRYAVFGNPIAHSRSPFIHNFFAEETGEDISYEKILAPLDGFPDAVRKFFSEGGRGCNVTVPFKEEAFAMCESLSPRAEAAGAVNTLIFRDGVISGDNTDGAGFIADLKSQGVRIEGARVLLIGAGGASRGILFPLEAERPASLSSRTAPSRRPRLSRRSAVRFRCPPGLRPMPQELTILSSTRPRHRSRESSREFRTQPSEGPSPTI